jgi:hypothetical protein
MSKLLLFLRENEDEIECWYFLFSFRFAGLSVTNKFGDIMTLIPMNLKPDKLVEI